MQGPPVRVGLAFGAGALPLATVAAPPGQVLEWTLPGPGGAAAPGGADLSALALGPATRAVSVGAAAALPVQGAGGTNLGAWTDAPVSAPPVAADAVWVGGGLPLVAALARAARVGGADVAVPVWRGGGFGLALLAATAGPAVTGRLSAEAARAWPGASPAAWPDPSGLAVTVAGNATFLVPGAAATVTVAVPGGDVTAGWDGARYRGVLLLTAGGAAVTVVNRLPLEAYVAGVVAEEMPATWPMAALEAQAIACRTFALERIAHASGAAYDLTDTAQDQVYGGADAETARTDTAVERTAGVAVTFAGQPIQALYEADSGGHTEDSVNVWGEAVPYLVGVAEPPGYVPLTWTANLNPAQLARDLRAAGYPATGPVRRLTVFARGVSGRAIGVRLYGPAGVDVVRDDAVRTVFDLDSNLFTVAEDSAVRVQSATGKRRLAELWGVYAVGSSGRVVRIGPARDVSLVGAAVKRRLFSTPGRYLLHGRGDGPGLGMTQDGARLLAQRGATASAILRYYYHGVTLSGGWDEVAPPASA
jgi:stage II sporulation protein D